MGKKFVISHRLKRENVYRKIIQPYLNADQQNTRLAFVLNHFENHIREKIVLKKQKSDVISALSYRTEKAMNNYNIRMDSSLIHHRAMKWK